MVMLMVMINGYVIQMTCAGADDVRLYVLFGWELGGGHLKERGGGLSKISKRN